MHSLKTPPQTVWIQKKKYSNLNLLKLCSNPILFKKSCTQLSVVLFKIMPDAGFIKQKQGNNGLKVIRSTEAAARLILKRDNTVLVGISTLLHFWHFSPARQAGCVEEHCDQGGDAPEFISGVHEGLVELEPSQGFYYGLGHHFIWRLVGPAGI